MVILLLIILLLLLAVFAPSVLFLIFGFGASVISDFILILLSVAISIPVILLMLFAKGRLLENKARVTGLKGGEINEAKYVKNEAAIFKWSILSGIVYALLGMVVYDSTHSFRNSSNVGMFLSVLVPFVVGIFITYCLITYCVVSKRINRFSKNKR